MEATNNIIREVKSCAIEVYETLGAGYEEDIYEEALGVEFRRRNISYEIERDVEVFYKGEKVGIHRLDFIVTANLVVELKSVTRLTKTHVKQTTTYLRSLKMKKGLLINFPYPQADKPEIKVVEIG